MAKINRNELQEHSNTADIQGCRGTKDVYPTLRNPSEMIIAPELGRSHQQHRVLCVDDNDLAVSMNATILRSKGYQVLSCSDPLQAASLAKSEELDLAILDYEMPLMNGAELATFCKAANPHIKVILFSGSLNISSHELAFADLFIQKSDGVEALLDAIEALLPSKQNRS